MKKKSPIAELPTKTNQSLNRKTQQFLSSATSELEIPPILTQEISTVKTFIL